MFFKWIQQHLVIKKLYGKSENAIYNQVYLAMITFCLTLLMQNQLGFNGTLLEMLEWISDCWDNSMTTFVSKKYEKNQNNNPVNDEGGTMNGFLKKPSHNMS
ncbi:hypothetical protein [Virgibacillus pantothenticus]|uniref:hypothetical protein n=1 Tax=Virgibacillus pantothenticus TaxID=1473 RepID=UPI001C24CDD3|nr:hypothetical protein [Virgibacillus pantothenticus]MBU8797091.1 hypothetical protein [Virgibacillus pantothenticus]